MIVLRSSAEEAVLLITIIMITMINHLQNGQQNEICQRKISNLRSRTSVQAWSFLQVKFPLVAVRLLEIFDLCQFWQSDSNWLFFSGYCKPLCSSTTNFVQYQEAPRQLHGELQPSYPTMDPHYLHFLKHNSQQIPTCLEYNVDIRILM